MFERLEKVTRADRLTALGGGIMKPLSAVSAAGPSGNSAEPRTKFAVPPIDKLAPRQVQTATFALG